MYEFSQPWAFVFCLIPLVVYKFFKVAEVKFQTALRVPFFEKMLAQDASQLSSAPWLWHLIGIWLLLVTALAGPRWVGEALPLEYATHNVMLVLDISGSMALEDVPTAHGYQSRWQAVSDTAIEFIKQRNQDKTGLILFGERPYLFAPLTLDQATLRERVLDAGVGMAGQATALGDALGLAIKHLQDTPRKGRVIILLTDGVANAGVLAAEKAAEIAKKENIKIYAIGLGPNANARSLSQVLWNAQQSDLDEKALKAISRATGGQYFYAADKTGLEKVYVAIDNLEQIKQVRRNLRPEQQYFYIPLLVALMWILILFFLRIWRDGL